MLFGPADRLLWALVELVKLNISREQRPISIGTSKICFLQPLLAIWKSQVTHFERGLHEPLEIPLWTGEKEFGK